MQEKTLISFVIPVYNAANFIQETVESILKAHNPEGITYEIICVNDKSSDGSENILNTLAATYPNVRAIHREKNGHVAAARNTGIDAATGQWICLVDSDDLVNQNIFKVIAKTVEDDCDIIYYGYDQFIDKPKADALAEPLPSAVYFDETAIRTQQLELLTRRKMVGRTYGYRNLGLIWAKLYRRDFIVANDIRAFEGMKYEEDLSFNFMCLARCKKAKQINWPFLHYRLVPVSFSHGYVADFLDRAAKTVPIYEEIIRRYYPGDKEIEALFPYRVLWELLFSVIRGPAHHACPDSWNVKQETLKGLLHSPLYKDVFSHVDIKQLDFPNMVLAYCVKKQNLVGCIVLERILQLKNKIFN